MCCGNFLAGYIVSSSGPYPYQHILYFPSASWLSYLSIYSTAYSCVGFCSLSLGRMSSGVFVYVVDVSVVSYPSSGVVIDE